MLEFFCVMIGIRLSLEDLQWMSISLEEVLLYWVMLFFLTSRLPTHCLFFLFLAILSSVIPIGIGSGDFFLLSIWSFVLTCQELFAILFIATLLALANSHSFSERKVLPFIPFLTLGLLALLFLKFVK